MVLVPDGPTVPVLWADMDFANPEEARENLRAREGVLPKNLVHHIGLWPGYAEQFIQFDRIEQWALAKGLHNVLWSALPPRYAEESGRVPTSAEALKHLKSLSGHDLELAKEYVCRAPAQIVTPYRRLMETTLGWRYDGTKTETQIR